MDAWSVKHLQILSDSFAKDTTAAMTGAIGGAHLGIDSIPLRLARHVHDRNSWRFDHLVALAQACWEVAS